MFQDRVAELNQSILNKANHLSKIQAQNISSSMWDVNEDAVKSAISGVLEDKEIYKIEVFDENNEIFSVVAKQSNIIEDEFHVAQIINYFDEDLDENRNIGTLNLYVTRYYLNISILKLIKRFAISGLILILCLLLFIAFIVNRFTKPLVNLTNIMRERLSGDYSSIIEHDYIKRDDEIGQISQIMMKEFILRNNEKERFLLELTCLLVFTST